MRLSQKPTIQEYPPKFLQKNIKYSKIYTIFNEKSDFLRLLLFRILNLFENKSFNKITVCPSLVKVKEYMNISFNWK